MKYLEWNSLIADYFFNPDKAGKDVYLYITKDDIINIAGSRFDGKADDFIWRDFISAIKTGLPGSGINNTIVEKTLYCYEQWKKPGIKSIDGFELLIPPYITYLIFLILPLTDESFDFHPRNYYDRLNLFLRANGISHEISSLKDLEDVWSDLEEWSIITSNGDLGFFALGKFNTNYKYVGKPFSQCILTPKAIKNLPELFLEAGMVPNSFYSDAEFKTKLIQAGGDYLNGTVLDLIKKSQTNELGKSIIEIVKREYSKWTGESHQVGSFGSSERAKRNYTVSSLLLQFKLNENAGTVRFSFRLYSGNDYPEDLKFGSIENLNNNRGYSRTIEMPERLSLQPFELKDDFNKWLARFPSKEIRLFINAGSLQLSTDYWIETDILSRTDWMYLLCKEGNKQLIKSWGLHFAQGNFFEEDVEGMPAGYFLFKILKPEKSLEAFPLLTVYTKKSIRLINGIKINFRTFLADCPPQVEIVNSIGNENVSLKYKDEDQLIKLKKNDFGTYARWELPSDVILNTAFYIKVDNENFLENDLAYVITSAHSASRLVNGNSLPKRDSLGRVASKDSIQYCVGSNVINPTKPSQRPYSPWEPLFTSTRTELLPALITNAQYDHHEGNILLSYLTLKNVSRAEEFYETFDFLHFKLFRGSMHDKDTNYVALKRASLQFYDYLGYLDYDYETNSIIVNPTQLIFIPAPKGRKCLLIGARDEELVKNIVTKAPSFNLQVDIVKQTNENQDLLLPDAIIVRSFGTASESYGEYNLKNFCDSLGIKFNTNDLTQLSLQHFSATINEYEQKILLEHETSVDDYNWARYVFNSDTLKLDKSLEEDFLKEFALIEYKLRPWEYYYRLWINNKCYDVDKNWGKYLVLKRYKKQVILFDSKSNKVAIPVQLPLPRLLAESIMLLSGIAPSFKYMENRAYRIYENIPGIFTENLFNKLGQQPINKELK